MNGAVVVKNLGVQIKGEPPRTLKEKGDAVFERSRAKAQAALEKLQLDLKSKSTAEELVQTIHELRTGSRVSSILLDDIGARWKDLPRRRPLSERYVSQAESWINRFVAFVKNSSPSIKEMTQIQSNLSRAFLKGSFITVKPSKTGEYVQIPIFPLLQEVLEKAMKARAPRTEKFVFPELEAHYGTNPDHLTDRVRRVMRAAGFVDSEDAETEEEKKNARGEIHQVRKGGLRKASVRDFHSFRVTWVTLALSAGVPLEIVQKVTGHRTAGIVMKHYFQPGREDFRRTLAGKMPSLLVQISNLIVRERWSSQRREITEAGRVSVNEALTSAREGMGGHLSEIMSAVISDLRRDAEKLDDGGMDLATDAAGVSSVQRAKRLFLERVFAVAGVDQAAPAAVTVNLSAFVARPMAAANGSAPAAEPAIEITASNADDLEFE